MMKDVLATPGYQLTVDLGSQTVTTPTAPAIVSRSTPSEKTPCIEVSTPSDSKSQHEANIAAYEIRRKAEAPWLFADLQS